MTSGPAVTPASSPSSPTRPVVHREDGGWLVGFVHDDDRNEADLVVLDAAAIDHPPVATVRDPSTHPLRTPRHVDPVHLTTTRTPTRRPSARLRAIPIPNDVVARLFHAASLLREHRGDGHIAAPTVEGVGGLSSCPVRPRHGHAGGKVRTHPPPPLAQLAAVIDGMRDRGLIGDDGWLSEQGRAVKQRVEALTDDLAAKPYESLEPGELDELMAALEPLAALLLAAQDW